MGLSSDPVRKCTGDWRRDRVVFPVLTADCFPMPVDLERRESGGIARELMKNSSHSQIIRTGIHAHPHSPKFRRKRERTFCSRCKLGCPLDGAADLPS